MRFMAIMLMAMFVSCGGKLSDEQRKEMKEGMKTHTIQRVTEAELMEAAFNAGRSIIESVPDSALNTDSLASANKVRIHWLQPGSSEALEIERQIIDAYVMNAVTGNDQPDNVQLVGEDSILYTRPVIESMPDGAILVKGTWNVWMSRKELILSMNK